MFDCESKGHDISERNWRRDVGIRCTTSVGNHLAIMITLGHEINV